MEAGSQLKALLQLQLASDPSSVAHLPYVLSSLNEECFVPNSHLAKWSARILSLLHSKDAGARWAGLCIAHKSSLISKSFMVDSASAWLPMANPILQRTEPTSILKAAIRLLVTVFTLALEMSEFQRLISLPNVPKFTMALANLAANNEDLELKEYCLDILAQLMPIYPNAHRATFANFHGLSLSFLNGSYPRSTPTTLMEAAARLYCILHLTGGKVGAANLWRKALDDNLVFGWEAFFALRTTFPDEKPGRSMHPQQGHNDPAVAVPLNVDRIRCCLVVIRDLLKTMTTRPVQMPCGQLIKFAIALLGATTEGQVDGFVDPITRAMEVAIVPSLWKYGCEVIEALADSIPHYLEPNLSNMYTALVYRLEQPLSQTLRAHIFSAFQKLFESSRFIDTPILPNRIARAVLPSITVILSPIITPTGATTEEAKSSRGKKKVNNYSGDEVFKVSRDVICPTEVDARVLLSALEILRHCIRNPNISSSQISLTSRVLLSVQLALTQLSPATLSPNPQVFVKVQNTVHHICTEVASTSYISMQKTLPLLVRDIIKAGDIEQQAAFDLLLHPRLPPVVRPIPAMQSLSLFRAEESDEEAATRAMLNLDFVEEGAQGTPKAVQEDAVMQDSFTTMKDLLKDSVQPSLLPTSQVAVPKPTPPVAPKPAAPSAWKLQGSVQPAPIPSSSSISPKPQTSAPLPVSDDEEEEEMPTIDTRSDSEDED